MPLGHSPADDTLKTRASRNHGTLSGDSGPPAMTSPARSTSPPGASGQAVGVLMARRTFDVGIDIIEILVPLACLPGPGRSLLSVLAAGRGGPGRCRGGADGSVVASTPVPSLNRYRRLSGTSTC